MPATYFRANFKKWNHAVSLSVSSEITGGFVCFKKLPRVTWMICSVTCLFYFCSKSHKTRKTEQPSTHTSAVVKRKTFSCSLECLKTDNCYADRCAGLLCECVWAWVREREKERYLSRRALVHSNGHWVGRFERVRLSAAGHLYMSNALWSQKWTCLRSIFHWEEIQGVHSPPLLKTPTQIHVHIEKNIHCWNLLGCHTKFLFNYSPVVAHITISEVLMQFDLRMLPSSDTRSFFLCRFLCL